MSFYEDLQKCTDEVSEVQPLYRAEIIKFLKKGDNFDKKRQVIVGNTDGIIPAKYFEKIDNESIEIPYLMLLECKLNESLEEESVRSKALLQTICYLKQLKTKLSDLPKVIILGSKIDCFSVPTECLLKYVDRDIENFTVASTAYKYNKSLLKEISKDDEISKNQSIIYKIWVDFSMESLVRGAVSMAQDMKLKFEVTEQNISKVFDYFTMSVLVTKKDSTGISCKIDAQGNALTSREVQNLFMSFLLGINDSKNYYLHPTKKGIAVFNGREIKVNRNAYLAFQNTYKLQKYALEDKKKFTETCDRLIEDADRRNKGDFYTPTVWVDEAHKMISDVLGKDWKDRFIVWDCACGTKNLTRDYKFKRLYSSTIEKGDIELSKRYNQTVGEYEGVAFQYDFLNDDVELFEKLLEKKKKGYIISERDFDYTLNGGIYCKLYNSALGLLPALLEKKPLLIFINPPYQSPGDISCQVGGSSNNVKNDESSINKLMKKDNMGICSKQLYAQFVYRVLKLSELFDVPINLAIFCKQKIVTTEVMRPLRDKMRNFLSFEKGYSLQANQFADCSSKWPVFFSVWKYNEGKKTDNLEKYNTFLKYLSFENEMISEPLTLYNLDNKESLQSWVVKPLTGNKDKNRLYLSSGLNVYHKQGANACYTDNYIGCYFSNGNVVEKNSKFVALTSAMMGDTNAKNITIDNFYRVVSAFSARKLISGIYANWVNDCSEYMAPNIEHPNYEQWESDCLVYSLFNTSSNQTSLRGIDYNGKKWDIKNEWFFMSEDEMCKLASGYYNDDDQNDDIEIDIENFGGDRFVYKELCKVELSEDAKKVLDKARELVIKSFGMRELYNADHPECHINTWDAGWYQIKRLLAEYYSEDLEEFNKLYKSFEDRMRPLVYELGFLYE